MCAVRLGSAAGVPPEFAFLQMRPLALAQESEELEIGEVARERLICRSASVLGNGRITDLRDVLVVDAERFDRARSAEVAQDLARLNATLVSEGVSYLLVGVGRWGSRDPWLGIGSANGSLLLVAILAIAAAGVAVRRSAL